MYAVVTAGPTSSRRAGAGQQAEERFRGAFEEAGIGMAVMGLDGRFLHVNRELGRMLGRTERELLEGDGIPTICHPADLDGRLDDFGELVSGRVHRYRRDRRYRHADGHTVWGTTTLTLVRDDAGRPLHVVGGLEDITARRAAEQRSERRVAQQAAVVRLSRLALTEQDFAVLAQATAVAIRETLEVGLAVLARLAPDGGVDAPLQLLSAAGGRLDVEADTEANVDPGHARLALAGGAPVIVADAGTETRFDVGELMARGLASGICVPVAGDRDGTWFGVLALYATSPRAFDDDDVAFLESIANVLTGVTQRLAVESDLRHQALHDPLTGLPNRALLLDRLRHGLARGRRGDRWLALLHLDLDDFKHINDSLGHGAGDDLLRDLAPRLAQALRPGDTLARVGGDEFAIVCESLLDPTESASVAERVLEVVGHPVTLGAGEFKPGASIGIALAGPGTAVGAEELVRDADVAMYRAKAAARGGYELFDEQMRHDTVEHVELTNDLRRAIERGELTLAFQPVVSYNERRVTGMEVLARWTHPERGEISPSQFIPLAEQHGLIAPLGSWVLRAALDQLAAWRDAGESLADRSLAINVSRNQLGRPELVDEIVQAVSVRGIPPGQLVIEVTESAVMDDPEVAGATLAALHDRGIHLALDDFGVGQSSLACLLDLPLDAVKLDRGFLTSLATSPKAAAIVRAVADMARTLRFPVVAEGVETEAQATLVEALGCDMGQGYLYARPVCAAEMPATVARLDAQLGGVRAAARV
jgi:diguanylate cyclase (GGDEF)-like protein/PAS domain S-box-containing protein